MLVDEIDEDYEIEEGMQTIPRDESTFDDLCGAATFYKEESPNSETEMGSWGLLEGCVLARVFHFLRSDIKSLPLVSLTCKHWRAAVSFYKDISRQIDLSSLGPICTDAILLSIVVCFTFVWRSKISQFCFSLFTESNVIVCLQNGYCKEKISSIVLKGCTNITSSTLEEILHSFPCLSFIDIRGCSQFGELALKFANVNWVKSRLSRDTKFFDESHSKIRSLKQITEKSSSALKKGLGSDADDFGELKDYFDSVDKRDSANQLFRRSLYKRSKLFDARKSSSILSRDARMRRWAIKKSENGYKRMEEFLLSGLRDIMVENTFEFFVPKVELVICFACLHIKNIL